MILFAAATGLGQSWPTLISQFGSTCIYSDMLITALCNFYLTTWEEYHTGVLFLAYFNGPVEGILVVTLIYFVTAIYGEIHLHNSDSRSWILESNTLRSHSNISAIINPQDPRRTTIELSFPHLFGRKPGLQYHPKAPLFSTV